MKDLIQLVNNEVLDRTKIAEASMSMLKSVENTKKPSRKEIRQLLSVKYENASFVQKAAEQVYRFFERSGLKKSSRDYKRFAESKDLNTLKSEFIKRHVKNLAIKTVFYSFFALTTGSVVFTFGYKFIEYMNQDINQTYKTEIEQELQRYFGNVRKIETAQLDGRGDLELIVVTGGDYDTPAMRTLKKANPGVILPEYNGFILQSNKGHYTILGQFRGTHKVADTQNNGFKDVNVLDLDVEGRPVTYRLEYNGRRYVRAR